MANPVAARGAWSIQRRNNAYQGRLLAGMSLAQAMPQNVSATAMGVWRSGVIATSSFGATIDLLAVAPGTGMTVNVHKGQGVVMRAGQGPYLGWSDTVVVLTLDAANAVNPRRDLIVMCVYDPALGDTMPTIGGVQVPCTIELVTGTPAASPSDPPVPANAIVLARVAVGANVTTITNANVTDLRKGLAAAPTAPRPLLGGDNPASAVTDPGYLWGEQRYRSAGGGLLEQVDVWGKDYAWHGLRLPVPPARRVVPGAGTVTTPVFATVNSTYTIDSITIPDPGYAYRITANARIFGTQGAQLNLRAFLRTGGVLGAELSSSFETASGAGTLSNIFDCPVGVSGDLTGATTLYWTLQRTGGSSNASSFQFTGGFSPNFMSYRVDPV